MKHSSMFVMYLTEDGKNVTISPRLGEGHVMPVYDNQTGLTVLSGSGVANGMITANVRCASISCPEFNISRADI